MNKKQKWMKVTIQGERYDSYLAPDQSLQGDLSCPACGSSAYVHKVTLVQHGFSDDNCCTICGCERCGANFHYLYSVEGIYAVLWTPQELEPPTGG